MPGSHEHLDIFLQYIESIFISGAGVAFYIPHHSSKTCMIFAITVTSHLLGYTSIAVKTQLTFFTLLAASFRILNVLDPYAELESFGSKLAFRSNPLAPPEQTKAVAHGEADDKKVISLLKYFI